MTNGKRKISHVYNTQLIRPRLWERFILWFVKLERAEDDAHVFFYKVFWNRLYLVGHICKQPKQLPKPSGPPAPMKPPKGLMDGYHTPWLN